ncbi:glycosyltransferase family 8 protein [Tilletiaria anomala UBC 951]|uniref:Glycosyltransferase family 8 protein n=1 Tax=Tilletiaria anomala (strain ATCC 24038 / CBS 436.72 / UBC 951) TaxID=1037660 RepID=A0A066W6U2_TILAU|nr:glycosyltransferase family 8 protein [Tilletiaria anomala UBC 951]KDN46789.1 glycosyltransferase family 8 protein [Tilletiaria anomala UBC 951]
MTVTSFASAFAKSSNTSIPPHAFVTLLTTDAYLPGALVLAHSLRKHHPWPDASAPATLASTSSKSQLPPPRSQPYHLVCLCTPATLRVQTIKALRQAFDVVIGVEPLSFAGIVRDRVEEERTTAAAASASRGSPGTEKDADAWKYEESARSKRRVRELAEQNLALLGRPDLGESRGSALTKLHLWRLTAYRRVVYLDADMLVLGNLSALFFDLSSSNSNSLSSAYPSDSGSNGTASSSRCAPILAAAPDIGWPDAFNSGLLALQPSLDTFAALIDFAVDNGSWDGADQGLLNDFFGEALDGSNSNSTCNGEEAGARREWGSWTNGLDGWSGPGWKRLSFKYNVTPNGGYTYAPAYQRYGKSILAAHFIGSHKPWSQVRAAARQPAISDGQQQRAPPTNDYNSLLTQWHDVFEEHYGGANNGQEKESWESTYDVMHTDKGVEVVERAVRRTTATRFVVPTYEAVWDSLGVRDSCDREGPRDGASAGARSLDDLKTIFAAGAAQGGTQEQKWGGMSVIYLGNDVAAYSARAAGEAFYFSMPVQGRLSLIPPPALPWIEEEKRAMDSEEAQRVQDFAMQRCLTPEQERALATGRVESEMERKQQSPNEVQDDATPPLWSPPQSTWNPALAPPPATSGEESYQMRHPPDAYYSNVWDEPHSRSHTQSSSGGSATSKDDFFPTRRVADERIPDLLQRQGLFQHLGNDRPDPTRVKPVFPWEEAGHASHAPSRVFPDEPHFSSWSSASNSSVAPSGSQPQQQQQLPASSPPTGALGFHRGLPANIMFANAWDEDPSIGRYAEHVRQRTRGASPAASSANAGSTGLGGSTSGSDRQRNSTNLMRSRSTTTAATSPSYADLDTAEGQDDEGDDESSDGEGVVDDDDDSDDEGLDAAQAPQPGAAIGRRKSWRKQAPSADYHRKAEAYGHGHHSALSSPRSARLATLDASPTSSSARPIPGHGRSHRARSEADKGAYYGRPGSDNLSASADGSGSGSASGASSASGGSSPTHRGGVGSVSSLSSVILASSSPQFTRAELKQMQRTNAQARSFLP